MDFERIKEVIKTRADMDLVDEYAKYITVGAIARNGLKNMKEDILSEQVYEQAISFLETRNDIIKELEKDWKKNIKIETKKDGK